MSKPDLFHPDGLSWTRVSDRLIVARLVTAGVWLLALAVVVCVAAVFVTAWIWWALGLLVAIGLWITWLVPRQVRALGYAERDEDLLIVRGLLIRTMIVVPYGRMQYVDVTVGPLARRLGIASVELHTAANLANAGIPGLAPNEAARLRDHLAARGEAKLAGL